MTKEKEEKDKKPKKEDVTIPDAETQGDDHRPPPPG